MATTLSIDSIDKFHKSLLARGKAEKTARAYRSDLVGFLEWIEDTSPKVGVHDYDEQACEYLTTYRREVSPSTTSRRRAALRSYARWAKIGVPYLDEYKGPSGPPAVAHPLPEGIGGVKRMIRACDTDEQKALIGLGGMAGCRVHESLSITPVDIDIDKMELTIRGKGDRSRKVPLQMPLLVLLAPLMFGPPDEPIIKMPDRTARRAITRMGKRAFLQRPVSSHDLRATFGTAVYNKTKDVRLVQELLGHSSSQTTDGYIGVDDSAKREASDLYGSVA